VAASWILGKKREQKLVFAVKLDHASDFFGSDLVDYRSLD
jgi:hypothetical protein